MKTVQKIGEMEIINWAGFYIIHRNGERVGGLYPSKADAFQEVLEMERERLGIKVKER